MARVVGHTFVKKSGNSESIKCEDRANLGKCHTEDGTRRFSRRNKKISCKAFPESDRLDIYRMIIDL